mgnify:CR=1 FL=1
MSKMIGDKPLTPVEKNKRYRLAHPEKIKAYKRKWHKENLEKARLANRKRNLKSRLLFPEKTKLRQLRYKNKDIEEFRRKVTKRHSFRYHSDIQYKIACRLRGRLKDAIKGNAKVGSAILSLGCSISELKVYLENYFTIGMNWNNYGKDGWHIDHILPVTSFDLTNVEQLKKACHFTNLQPLWAVDNIKKGNKILCDQQKR